MRTRSPRATATSRSSAIGAAAGCDLVVEAALITAFVLAGNTMLHPLVTWIERRPLQASRSESRIEVRISTDAASLPVIRRHLIERLQAARYPVADVEVVERGQDRFEVTAVLVSTAAVAAELDAVVAGLARHAGVGDAAWESSSLE